MPTAQVHRQAKHSRYPAGRRDAQCEGSWAPGLRDVGKGGCGAGRRGRLCISLGRPVCVPHGVWTPLSPPRGPPRPLLTLKFECKAELTHPGRKGENHTGHLSPSLCFLLGAAGVREGEDSCLLRSPQKERLCQRSGACSAGVTLGALLPGVRLSLARPSLRAQAGPGPGPPGSRSECQRTDQRHSWLSSTRPGSWGVRGAGGRAAPTPQSRQEGRGAPSPSPSSQQGSPLTPSSGSLNPQDGHSQHSPYDVHKVNSGAGTQHQPPIPCSKQPSG